MEWFKRLSLLLSVVNLSVRSHKLSIQFIAPEKVSSERGQLVPVLATMLKLSNEETELLNKVAQGWLFISLVCSILNS